MRPQSNFPSTHPDWGVADIGFVLSPDGNWGLGRQELAMAIQLLHIPRRGAVTAEEAPDRLTFSQFELLLRVLEPDMTAGVSINDAVRLRYEQVMGERQEASYITALQEILNTLLSTTQTRLAVDGVWTLAAEEALRTVGQAYNLNSIKRNAHLLTLLQTIGGRVPRWACADSALREQIQYNPFLTMVDGVADFELSTEASRVVLRHPVSKDILFGFPASGNRLPNQFPQFTAWLAMLHAKPSKPRHMGTVEIRFESGEWQALDAFRGRETTQFAIPPDYCLHVQDPSVRFHVRVRPFLSPALDLIGVWFNADLSFAVTPGYAVDEEGPEIVKYFDSEYFFPNLGTEAGVSENVTTPKKANYFKLFVVNRNFPSNAETDQYQSFAGTETDGAYYRLLTASEMDIHQSWTFGIEDSWPLPAKDKWILLAGTGEEKLPESTRWMAEALGIELAKEGYGLMVGGWPGVDEVGAKAFASQLAAMGISDRERLRQVIETSQAVRYAVGELERLPSPWLSFTNSWYDEAVKRADALIIIGGNAGTERLRKAAAKAGKPIFPLPATGGVAKETDDAMVAAHGGTPPLPDAIRARIADPASATKIAVDVLSALDEILRSRT